MCEEYSGYICWSFYVNIHENFIIPKRHKRSNLNSDLHGAFKISDLDGKVSIITNKYLDSGYPIVFIKSVISDLFKLPYCPSNEHDFKRFIDRTESFTEDKIMLIVLWSTRNIKSFFQLKNKVAHRSWVIHDG